MSSTDVLANDYPLMIKLREVAPGTANHSKEVVSVVDSVGTALGLDETEHRTLVMSAQYHDIGKMRKPQFYTENYAPEDSEDPHADIPAELSYFLITSHVADSVEILINDPNIPREVVECVAQHHGTLVCRYFFNKSGLSIAEADKYRYKGEKPKTTAAGVLMMCDTVTSALRSMNQSGKLDDSPRIIERLVWDLIHDGQLDCLSIGLMRKTIAVLQNEMSSQYGTGRRVDYDKKE